MKFRPRVSVSLVLVLTASSAAGSPGEPRAVQGVLAWAAAAESAPFAVVQGDDGRYYVVDLSNAQRRGGPVSIGDRVSAAGVEGQHPWQVAARVVGEGDTAVSPQAAPSDAIAASPAMPPAPDSRAWRQIRGTVDAVTDGTVRLREVDGRKVTVDLSRLGGRSASMLRPGDRATVFVIPEDGQRLVAVGVVQTQTR